MVDIPLTNLVFSVCTVSYGPSFIPSIYDPSAKRAGFGAKTRMRNREQSIVDGMRLKNCEYQDILKLAFTKISILRPMILIAGS